MPLMGPLLLEVYFGPRQTCSDGWTPAHCGWTYHQSAGDDEERLRYGTEAVIGGGKQAVKY